MPDITMCKGEDCPVKEYCYRYTAVPTPQWQSYFVEPPFIRCDKCGLDKKIKGIHCSNFVGNEMFLNQGASNDSGILKCQSQELWTKGEHY